MPERRGSISVMILDHIRTWRARILGKSAKPREKIRKILAEMDYNNGYFLYAPGLAQ